MSGRAWKVFFSRLLTKANLLFQFSKFIHAPNKTNVPVKFLVELHTRLNEHKSDEKCKTMMWMTSVLTLNPIYMELAENFA